MPCHHSCLVTGHSQAAFQCPGSNHLASYKQSALVKRSKGFLVVRPKLRKLGLLQASAQESSNGGNWEREEARWFREEERWKREEQRWLREEQRWNSERESWSLEAACMKEEIKSLKQELELLQKQQAPQEGSSTLREVLLGLKGLLQTLNASQTGAADATTQKSKPQVQDRSRISEQSSAESIKFILSDPPKPEAAAAPAAASKTRSKSKPEESSGAKQQRTLKQGAEGEDVKMLQEALSKLGFYSGEDDMEYSSFSSGTDRAVKSWQASIGAPQDGIVTAQIFTQLISGREFVAINNSAVVEASVESSASVETHRVYLLGENRWEDPNRLLNKKPRNIITAQKCLSCKGEGRTLCTECEGTGELNVEEQFLEWAGDGAKCPYCEGSGTVICDVCDGKGV